MKENILIDFDRCNEKIKHIESKGKTYHIVPTINVRCFAPCEIGYCICSADIVHYNERFTIVDDDGKKRAIKDLNLHLQTVREDFEKQNKKPRD